MNMNDNNLNHSNEDNMRQPFLPEYKNSSVFLSMEGLPMSAKESFKNLSKTFETDIDASDPEKSRGLTLIKVLESRKKYGRNIITDTSQKRELKKLRGNFLNWFNLLLIIESLLSFLYKYLDEDHDDVDLVYAIFFLALIFLNCLMVFYQEHRFRSPETFREILPSSCKVIREGKSFKINTNELVPGDIVEIKAGGKIPADLRIITNHDIKIQQSDINGESDCIEASTKRVENNELEIQHIIYAGSKCLEGLGKGVVILTGDHTYLGRIAQSSAGESNEKNSIIQRQLNKIVMFVLCLDIITMIIATFVNIPMWKMKLGDYVSISFGNIPQALPLTTTLCLTIVARRLQKKNIVVKRLDCLESLSSASVVFCDKTGTLTMNKMTVLNFWFNTSVRPLRQITDTYEHYQNEQDRNNHPLKKDKTWRILFKTAYLCNNAKRKIDSDELEGGSEDQALLSFCLAIDSPGLDHYKLKYETRVFDIFFKSSRKFQVTVRGYSNGKKCLLMKGAPEVVLLHCNTFLRNGNIIPIDEKFKESVDNLCTHIFGKKGERILAVGYKQYLNPNEVFTKATCPAKDLIFIGLFTFLDPPKPDVEEAIRVLKEANLKIHMITGDLASTAECLAKKLDILSNTTENLDEENNLSAVITGQRLATLTPLQWSNLMKKDGVVFARVSPEDKQIIVRKYKEDGKKKVIMIGDGANDALALKEADVGIVLGKNCSILSQDVADLIFKEDNFNLIVHCIEQGRIFFDNLKKTVAYTLAHCILEVVPCFLSAAICMPLAISNLQMLMIDFGTEMIPAISLAFLQTKEKIMERYPRDHETDTLVSWKLLFHSYIFVGSIELFWCLFAYFINFGQNNINDNYCHVGIDDFNKELGDHHFVANHENEVWNFYCTSEQQKMVLSQVQMAWFTTVVLGQFANILLMVGVKNIMTLVSVGIEIILLVFMIWVPDLVKFFFLKDPRVQFKYNYPLLLTPWIGILVCLFLYYKGRKWCKRRNLRGKVTQFFNW